MRINFLLQGPDVPGVDFADDGAAVRRIEAYSCARGGCKMRLLSRQDLPELSEHSNGKCEWPGRGKSAPGIYVHSPSNTEYNITARDGGVELAYRSQSEPGVAGQMRLDYFLGSGHLGTTYLYSIGDYLFESPGEREEAEKAFRRVLELAPSDLTALSNLGTLLAKEGKLKEGEALLREAFDRNQDIPGLALNLARVQCMTQDGQAARTTLVTALIYCPNVEDMRRLLTQMGNCGSAGAK
jgi:hypothetical protein